jgi:ATP-dependent Clp protease adaptor protein ClpS
VTRTAKYKALYLAMLLGVSIMVFGIGMALTDRIDGARPATPLVLVALAIMLLLPGRLLGFFWRDLLAGLRLLKRKDYAASKLRSERFIAKVRKAPWLKHLIWLGTSSYSRDPEAMALNNLGVAEINLGAFEAAENHLEETIALDPQNPLPYRNMGVLRLEVGTWAEARPWFEKAEALGLSDGWSDRMAQAAQSRFASNDGGVAADHGADQPTLAQPDLPPATGKYSVELLNDDVTSMEFVIDLLEQVFDHSGGQAVRTMLAVHDHGSAVCGRYEEAEAQARMDSAIARARAAGFPLSFRVATDTAV